ncbi:hypothetical protein SRHO_G00041600 [Serrasalmus rhombeus]
MPSNETDTHCGLSPQTLVASILPPVLIIQLLLGLPGNLIALWVFSRHLQSWKHNAVFLFNLDLADFLLLNLLYLTLQPEGQPACNASGC